MGEIISSNHQRTPSSAGKVEDPDVSISVGALADRSPSSDSSTPGDDHDLDLGDHDLDHEAEQHQDDVKPLPAPPQKRKGGRKPVRTLLYERAAMLYCQPV